MRYQPRGDELENYYLALGKGLSEFQKFEYLLAVIICVVKNEEFKSVQEAWGALDIDFKKTLGKLHTQLKNNIYFTETFRYHLAETVYERNWVVHTLPRAMYGFCYDQHAFERLLLRLKSTRESCKRIRLMLENWFFKEEQYKNLIQSLPTEILETFEILKKI